ncbi:MAG: hypothetical protein ONB44_18640 [candidate division KSB1 bacterium]|nr:hypothetical protein [candidate division KSB1 bacterium]MDZ7310622.1 hypothetical protein [candidate division KSB1 bacterium]
MIGGYKHFAPLGLLLPTSVKEALQTTSSAAQKQKIGCDILSSRQSNSTPVFSLKPFERLPPFC